MPDCVPFRLYVGEQLSAVMGVLTDELPKRGATVDADGRFALSLPIGGVIRGRYVASGLSLVVTIEERPTMVSCGMIESKLQDYILDAKAVLKGRRNVEP